MCIWFTFILDSRVPLATQLCNCSWISVGGLKRSDVDCCVAVCNFPRLTAGFWICVCLQHLIYNLCPNLVPCNDACFMLGPKKKWSLLPVSEKQRVALSSLFRRLSPMRHGVDAVRCTLNHIWLLTHTAQTVFDQLIRLLICLAAVNLGVCVGGWCCTSSSCQMTPQCKQRHFNSKLDLCCSIIESTQLSTWRLTRACV